MIRAFVLVFALILTTGIGEAAEKKKKGTRFWNLTGETISRFELAKAGTTEWGPDHCKNEKDGTSEHDERMRIEGVAPGLYDARMTFVDGRLCYARGLEVKEGEVFSVEHDQLKDCVAKQ